MKFSLPYDTDVLEATLNWAEHLGFLDISEAPAIQNIDQALRTALNQPIGESAPFSSRIPTRGSILILVSDSFRATGADRFLPPLIDYLSRCGVEDQQIAFLFATGSHRPPTPEEQAGILGPAIFDRFRPRIYSHNPNDGANLVFKGNTSRGTPVYLNRRAEEASCVVVTGAVVLHYFGGFGGGRKAIVPGIAGIDTIAANHALNLDPVRDQLNPDVGIGRTAGNPVAEDMLEGARMLPGTFLINTVLNCRGEIAGLFCGHLEQAHREACEFAASLFALPIAQRADLVIASAGSAKNFVQSHKALFNASQALRPGGRIILAAPAREGFGGSRFAEWLALGSREAIIAELRRHAEINGQTALSTREKAPSTLFITELTEGEVRLLGGRKATDLPSALDTVRAELSEAGITRPTCYIMPSAGYTVPFHQPGRLEPSTTEPTFAQLTGGRNI